MDGPASLPSERSWEDSKEDGRCWEPRPGIGIGALPKDGSPASTKSFAV